MTGKTKSVDSKTELHDAKPKADDDIEERPYYYDDAQGYEEFDPAEKDEIDDE